MKNTKIPGRENAPLGSGFGSNLFNHPNFGFPGQLHRITLSERFFYLQQSLTSILGLGGGAAAPRIIQLKAQPRFLSATAAPAKFLTRPGELEVFHHPDVVAITLARDCEVTAVR